MTRAGPFATALLAVAGCNGMLDLEGYDYVEGTAGNAGVTGGTGTGNAGAGGAGTTGAAGGLGGAGATTATGGAGATGASGGTGGMPADIGCSDGSREAYSDVPKEPNIAACAGGFSVPGVKSGPSMTPACNRVAGDDSANPNGTGCSVADLCATGWHVCETSAEVAASAASGACPPDEATSTFWVTRQAGEFQTGCTANGVNDLRGCGSMIGATGHATCAPLDTEMSIGACDASAAWVCGPDNMTEPLTVTKILPAEGGALCCKD